jgi:hypothetical protein
VSSLGKRSRTRSYDSQSVDAARAAELDRLVDLEDWDGVVAAAAKFESQQDPRTVSDTGSGSQSVLRESQADDWQAPSVHPEAGVDPATGNKMAGEHHTSGPSESDSKTQKRVEIRSEVETLVRRVVPEEIDNVDKMMKQYKGREDELLATLRTMQNRATKPSSETQV